jgi:hypothetical protein
LFFPILVRLGPQNFVYVVIEGFFSIIAEAIGVFLLLAREIE